MIAILLSALAASAAGAVYLKRYSEKEKRAIGGGERPPEREFRSALAHELRGTKVSGFSFAEFVGRCGMEQKEAELVAQELYGRLCERVLQACDVKTAQDDETPRFCLQLDEATSSGVEWFVRPYKPR